MSLDRATRQMIIGEIETAFSSTTPPGDARLRHPQCRDDGDIVDFYGARDRRDLSDDDIIGNYAALSFFSAEAFQYYMPAFMIWSLTRSDSIEYVVESTLRAFDPTGENQALVAFQASKYALFTDTQRAAVILFLEAFTTDPDLGPIARGALRSYWRP